MLEIIPFRKDYILPAAEMFIRNFRKLREAIPILPDTLEHSDGVCARLEELFGPCPGAIALQDGEMVGYMGWYIIPNFRQNRYNGAYCPEWSHATLEENRPEIYRALYRAAATHWSAAGCQVHAVTLLANDPVAEKTWFWNGFGLTVVDAVRPLTPLGVPVPAGLAIRKAVLADVKMLEVLEAEHWQHYGEAPVLMMTPPPSNAADFTRLLEDEHNSAWLALDDGEPVGYIRFEESSFGAAASVNAETTIAITGLYVRPAYRGQKAAAAMLDAALVDHAARGFERCAVDFESFNPEATSFWMRYFEPVCLSVTRVPEKQTI